MRRIYTTLVFLLALSMSSWAGVLFFPQPLVDFPINGDEPETRTEGGSTYKYYCQHVWWYWNDDMSDNPFALTDYESDFIWSVDVTGGITIPEGKYLTKDGDHYELSSSEIYFNCVDGQSGTITMTATQPDFNGIPYSASYTINYHTYTLGETSHLWDFYSQRLAIGRYKDGNSELNGGLWQHQWMGYANQSPEIYVWNFGDIDRNSEDYFRNNFNRNGHIIEEANGLQFLATKGNIGIYNENDSTTAVGDRFLAIKKGSSVIIPSSIFKNYSNPRVRFKMAKYGDNIKLTVHNAYDALGTEITGNGTYVIGGSAFWGGKHDWHYRGEYHFQIKDKNEEFRIDVHDGQWLLLYLIEVYDQKEIKSENTVLASNYQFLNTNTTTTPASGYFYLHYRGKAERTRIAASTITTTGTVTNSINDFTNVNGGLNHTYTSHKGEFGTFRMRLDSYTLAGGNDYCTDYAYRTQSVGYMEPKSYPYTWDFTDINTYKDADFKDDKGVVTTGTNKMPLESTMNYKQQPQDNHFKGITYIPRNVWESDGSFRVSNDAAHNFLYCGGSQLWYGKTIIPETAGLAFTPVNYDGAYNGAMTLTSNGLLFNQDIRDWWLWRIMIPQVDKDCVIYIRARKLTSDELAGDSYYNVGYCYCYADDENLNLDQNGFATNKTPQTKFSTAAIGQTAVAREIAVDNSGDVIYAIPAPSKTTNVALFFNGVEVHKIAVSKDPKTVNKYGWATESRDRVIDQELTSYFTGKDFVTYLVDEVNSSNTSVKLSDVTMTSNVMEKSNGSDYNAYIIRNKDAEILKDENGNVVKDENDEVVATGKVDILKTGGGFHLFVPDIHDYVKIGENTSDYNQKSVNTYKPLLRAKLNPGGVTKNETIDGVEYTNFVLTWQVADITEGQQGSQYDFENVGFFRVQDAGIQSKGNQGYLPLILASGNTTNKYNIVWDDDTNGIDATITDNVARRNDNVFYNLSGQRLNGVPTKGGIYIVNGKKIVVK